MTKAICTTDGTVRSYGSPMTFAEEYARILPIRSVRHARAMSTILPLLVLAVLEILHPVVSFARPELVDEPVLWYDLDQSAIAEPSERDPGVGWDAIKDTAILPPRRFFDPVRFVRRVGTVFGGDHVKAAPNVNSLGEVPNSSWFTNRIGMFPMTAEEAAGGPAGIGGVGEAGPDRSGPWTVVSAKTQGVTPGFNIRDALGNTYLIKFDPPGELGTATCAGAVSGRIFHAIGYNVPVDATVSFEREELVLGENVRIRLKDGSRRPMTEADLEDILSSVDRLPDGRWFAIASKFLDGKPVGPFNFYGRREDDPNDRIPHEDRRELRGLEVFCAWLNHFDTKQLNSLDTYIAQGDAGYVKHHLLDFASTLGVGASGSTARYGYEYTVDVPAILGRTFSLGLHESTWRKLERDPNLPQVGYFSAEHWDPTEFKPMQPNTAFANATDDDGYWAAKIITAFRDEHIEAIVARAGYHDEPSAAHIVDVLKKRRDRIGREFFDEIPPLEFFARSGDRVTFRDLGAERNIYPDHLPLYEYRCAAVNSGRDAAEWTTPATTTESWIDLGQSAVERVLDGAPVDDYPFVAVEVRVRRYADWSVPVTAYLSRKSGRTVALDR